MTQTGEPVIRVADLRKYYGDVKAVDGVTFEVARGEVFGLLGPNGAGKTTTIEVLEGLRPPDSGTVEVLGLDVRTDSQSIKERIGVQLQSVSLYPRLTVTELLDLFGSFFSHRVPTKQLIEAVDLGERAKAWSMNLSGGQQQRLSIALALVNDPELVFLDEPTTGLDPQARRSLWDLIRGLQERGKSVMLTTHYMEEATELCEPGGDHGPRPHPGDGRRVRPDRHGASRSGRSSSIQARSCPLTQLARLGGVTRAAQEDGQTVLYSQ